MSWRCLIISPKEKFWKLHFITHEIDNDSRCHPQPNELTLIALHMWGRDDESPAHPTAGKEEWSAPVYVGRWMLLWLISLDGEYKLYGSLHRVWWGKHSSLNASRTKHISLNAKGNHYLKFCPLETSLRVSRSFLGKIMRNTKIYQWAVK